MGRPLSLGIWRGENHFEGKVVKGKRVADRQKERERERKAKKKRQDKSHGSLSCIVFGISMAHFGTTPEYK